MYLSAALPATPRNKEQVSESPRSQAPNCPLGWAGEVRTGTDPTGVGGDWPSPRGPGPEARPGCGRCRAVSTTVPCHTCTAHLRTCSQAHTALFLSQTLRLGLRLTSASTERDSPAACLHIYPLIPSRSLVTQQLMSPDLTLMIASSPGKRRIAGIHPLFPRWPQGHP